MPSHGLQEHDAVDLLDPPVLMPMGLTGPAGVGLGAWHLHPVYGNHAAALHRSDLSLHRNRRALLWHLPAVLRAARREDVESVPLQEPVLTLDAAPDVQGGEGELSDFTDFEKLVFEFAATGFSPDQHFLAFLRPKLVRQSYRCAKELSKLADGQKVNAAGLVVRPHRLPTRGGRTVVFVTLEDETGLLDVTIFEDVYHQSGYRVFTHPAVGVRGTVQRQGGGVSLVAQSVWPVSLRP